VIDDWYSVGCTVVFGRARGLLYRTSRDAVRRLGWLFDVEHTQTAEHGTAWPTQPRHVALDVTTPGSGSHMRVGRELQINVGLSVGIGSTLNGNGNNPYCHADKLLLTSLPLDLTVLAFGLYACGVLFVSDIMVVL